MCIPLKEIIILIPDLKIKVVRDTWLCQDDPTTWPIMGEALENLMVS